MKKQLITLFALVMFASSTAYAGQFGLGATGSLAVVEGAGTESDQDGTADTSHRDATASNNVFIGSVFGEYTFESMGGMTFGIDYIPGSADINSKTLKQTNVAGLFDTDADESTKTINAEVSDVITYYAELPLHGGLYFKAGMTTMDITTADTDTNAAGSKYGNADAEGILLGLGYRNSFGTGGGFYKVEGSHTEFDTITLKDNITDKGNQVKADLDVTRVTFAVGYNF